LRVLEHPQAYAGESAPTQ